MRKSHMRSWNGKGISQPKLTILHANCAIHHRHKKIYKLLVQISHEFCLKNLFFFRFDSRVFDNFKCVSLQTMILGFLEEINQRDIKEGLQIFWSNFSQILLQKSVLSSIPHKYFGPRKMCFMYRRQFWDFRRLNHIDGYTLS